MGSGRSVVVMGRSGVDRLLPVHVRSLRSAGRCPRDSPHRLCRQWPDARTRSGGGTTAQRDGRSALRRAVGTRRRRHDGRTSRAPRRRAAGHRGRAARHARLPGHHRVRHLRQVRHQHVQSHLDGERPAERHPGGQGRAGRAAGLQPAALGRCRPHARSSSTSGCAESTTAGRSPPARSRSAKPAESAAQRSCPSPRQKTAPR